ncbi:hypothetical protein CYMTET_13535 [Cymbomonas tetramitiformis]|uniref:Uncharacterized protein n=1 Tax=Cymbomonas tetramitiformis TaxID=36881 RepID=A0AAE0GI74_9CHLO|nr:hypothetical protein CYMTET_13535 [Cymbomonas tetramitiformis]|eukprot:gene3523-4436_t
MAFDHAAPYFVGSAEGAYSEILRAWEMEEWIQRWSGEFLEYSYPDGEWVNTSKEIRWVGAPGMSSICKGLSDSLAQSAQLLYGQHVKAAVKESCADYWVLTVEDRFSKEVSTHNLDYLILTDKLLIQDNKYGVLPKDYQGSLGKARAVASSTIAVLMVAFPCGSTPKFDSLQVTGHPVIREVLRENSKPARSAEGLELFVVHSTAEYAERELKDDWFRDEETARIDMLSALVYLFSTAFEGPNPVPSPVFSQAHMWDCAQPLHAHLLGTMCGDETPYLLDRDSRLGACGDYCSSTGGVLGAALSGTRLGQVLASDMVQAAALKTDFTGSWRRDVERSWNLEEFLCAHGHSAEAAKGKVENNYSQVYERSTDEELVWLVSTRVDDSEGNLLSERKLVYPLGNWEESLDGRPETVIFGSQTAVAQRHTSWEPHPEASTGVAHVTATETALGREETKRWTQVTEEGEDLLMVARTFKRKNSQQNHVVEADVSNSCIECFVRYRDT